jgi:hypothetical protein
MHQLHRSSRYPTQNNRAVDGVLGAPDGGMLPDGKSIQVGRRCRERSRPSNLFLGLLLLVTVAGMVWSLVQLARA